MADLAKGALRNKRPLLARALEGRVSGDDRFLLKMQLHRIKEVQADLDAVDQRLEKKLEPYQKQVGLLMTIPGVGFILAAAIVAELGVDMSVFFSKDHLSAWAGVCPGCSESAGKKKNSATRKGNIHLKTALVQAATSAAKKKGSYLRDKYFRLKARRGACRAAMAIAHKIAEAAYHILSTGDPYKELGETYLDELNKKAVVDRAVRRLDRLGYDVQLTPKATSVPPSEGPAAQEAASCCGAPSSAAVAV